MVQRFLFPVVMVCLMLSGCTAGPPVSEGTLTSPDPAARLYAIRRAGEQRDTSAVRQLIELLDSADPAERLMTIEALERITGTRLDYDPYANPQQREVAIASWVKAADSNQFAASVQP